MHHVAVVGGGPAGLFAALSLTRSGHEVTVFESGPWGGRARCVGPEGYSLNLGPHALYPDSAALLRRRGVTVEGGMPDASGFRMSLDGSTVPLPSGAMGLLSHRSLRMGEKLALARWLASISRRRARSLAGITVSAWLDRTGLEGSARKVAEMLVRLTSYTDAPHRLCAGAAMGQLAAGFEGVLYVHGGWQAIVGDLVSQLSDAGVALRDHTRVAAVAADGVRLTDGTRAACEAVVLALPPKVAVRLLGAHVSPSLERFAKDAAAVRAACLDVASEGEPTGTSIVLGADAPTYLSVASAGARVAEEGTSVVHLARYLVPGEPMPEGVRAELEANLARVHPDVAERIVHARFSPAMTVMHALPDARTGGLAGRPDVDGAGPPWARLAGDWVGPEGMLLDAALHSAERAARSLAEAGSRPFVRAS